MKPQTYHSPKTTISIALLLSGVGLILIGLASAMMIPRVEATATEKGEPEPVSSASVIPARVDFPAPELRLSDLSGEPFSLADFAGQVVLVNNWAIWCPPCKAELPDLNDFYQAYKHQDFVIIGVESGSPEADVAQYVSNTGLAFPIWLDPGQVALDAFRNYSLPSSYVVDRGGQVRLAWTGAINYTTLEEYVAPLLQ